MRHLFKTLIAVILTLSFIGTSVALAELSPAPANVSAALIIKLAAFEKKVAGSGDVTIYVMGDADVAKEFQTVVGAYIGGARLKSVKSGNELPTSTPTILYLGNSAKAAEATKYAQTNKILSTTGIPDLVSSGITLGIGIGSDGKPKVLLNKASSGNEGCEWNPAIMKVATVVK